MRSLSRLVFLQALLATLLLIAIILSGCAGALGKSFGSSSTPLSITTSTLPAGTSGTAYSATLSASGGQSPYTWTMVAGALPAGLSLNSSSGAISGTPSASGTFNVTFGVRDAQGMFTTANLSLAIAAVLALQITTASLPDGIEDVEYSAQVDAAGGTPPYSWSLGSGSLPGAVSLAATSGLISGTPTTSGTFTPVLTVTDSAQQAVSNGFSFTISNSSKPQLPVFGGISVSSITSTSATITWNTGSQATDGLVMWGPVASLYNHDSGVLDSAGRTSHSYTITGLYPDTHYAFALRSRPIGDSNQQHWAVYAADGCTGACSFTTLMPSSGSYDYYLYFKGPHNVIQSYDTYLDLELGPLQGSYPGNNTLSVTLSVSGASCASFAACNIAVQWVDTGNWANANTPTYTYWADPAGLPANNNPGHDVRLITGSGGVTPPGIYTITATGGGAGIPAHTATWTLNVNMPSFANGTPTSYPAIPCLNSSSKQMDGASSCASNWTDTMSSYGQFWCPEDSDNTVVGTTPACASPAPISGDNARCIRPNDTSHLTPVGGSTTYDAWFYDGLLVYQQIGTYQNNPSKWAVCGANVNQVYRDGYVIPNNGGLAGYMIFTEGLYQDYVASGTTADKTAVDGIYQNAQFAQTFHGEFNQTGNQREAAYRLEADLWASMLDNPVHTNGLGPGWTASQWVQYDVAHVISQIEQMCTQSQPYEYFMAGLQAEALIKYYLSTGSSDVRIPPAVKQLADCVYSAGWGKTVDDPYAFPYSSAYSTYGFSIAGMGGSAGGAYSLENLNLLIAPMYAWLYSITGNSTYQTQGDTIFQYGVMQPTSGGIASTIGYTGNGGKQFSQNYRWSINFVKWRSHP